MNKQKITHILLWVIKDLNTDRFTLYETITREWVDTIERLYLSRGGVETIAILKAIRTHCAQILAGNPLVRSLHPAVGLNRSLVPKALKSAQPLLKGDKTDLRVLFTLLILSRELEGWKPVDTLPITDLPKVDYDMKMLQQIANLCPKPLEPVRTDFKEFHISSKGGPNGLALDTALVDLALLPESGIAKAIVTLGGETLKEMMNETFSLKEYLPVTHVSKTKENLTLRRLSVKKDKESKSRVFAILDYWSQTSLKTLHEEIFKLLATFKADCTSDQGKRIGRVIPRPFYYSIDLSNATDRFPIKLQQLVLSNLIGDEKADAWVAIMTQIPFSLEGKTYKYNTGQPMGAYSSWGVFALSHHLTVQYAARIVGKPNYSNYMMLGDDVVLGDQDVAESYMLILTKLGVEYSKDKTHISKNFYEFAKRIFYNEVEITGIPIHSLLNYSGPSSALNFFSIMDRNWARPQQTYSRSALSKLLRPLVPQKQLHIEVMRTQESQYLPIGPVHLLANDYRLWLTYEHLCNHHLRCFATTEKVISLLSQLIPVAKIKAAQKAIKETVRGTASFITKLVKLNASHPDFNKELIADLPQYIHALPIARVSLAYARGAQLQLDKMENLIMESKEEQVLLEKPILGFNPLKLVNVDRAEARFMAHSQLPKEIKNAIRDHAKHRAEFKVMNYQQADAYAFKLIGQRLW